MSLSSRSNQYGKVLGDWNIRKEIGKGSHETVVYQIIRKDGNRERVCALKAIPIISERGIYERLSDRRKKEYQKELSGRKDFAMHEVENMISVCGRTNIVNYFDHGVAEWEDENEYGCDLLIRMELLHDLRSELERGRIFSEAEVIHIGRDICSALIVCHGKDILHRDIKPENIFFNSDGDYKLGDFGIARILDKCPGSYASTSVGTPAYIAPEQLKSGYTHKVDFYSLGLVLYELTNQNRLPFAESSYVKDDEIEERLRAKTLPKPSNASHNLAKVILKACAHAPEDRYQSAQEMLDALAQIGNAGPAERRPSVPLDSRPTPSDPIKSGYETKPASTDPGSDNSSQDSEEQHPALSDEVRSLLNKADAGDVEAMKNLGDCYYYGRGVEKDYSVAVKWYQKAADHGYAVAMAMLGNCCYFGWGFKRRRYSVAVKWYRKAADQGNVFAQYSLGGCYYYGTGVKKDYSKAVEWYQKAADQGDADAQEKLGDCYYRGEGVKRSYSKAIKWYQKAADQGKADAQEKLGDCYYLGRDVEEDYSKAIEWYLEAADQGNAGAQYKIGFFCYYGMGTKQDYSEAAKWFQWAATRTPEYAANKDARFQLGDCYHYGRGVKKDYSQAVEWYQKAGYYYRFQSEEVEVKWFQKAADLGSDFAQYRLGHCYYYGTGVKKNYSKAVVWYQKAADQGYAAAQYKLGDCYHYGRGVKKDYSKAVEWYQKAADQENADAQKELGDCYYCGKGLSKDITKAMDYYLQAMEQGNIEAAVQYHKILTRSKQSDKKLLADNGHTMSYINEEWAAKIGERRKHNNEEKSTSVGEWLFAGAILTDIVLWFVYSSFWICFGAVLGLGFLGAILFALGDGDPGIGETVTIISISEILLPIITTILVAVIEGILFLGKLALAFFV